MKWLALFAVRSIMMAWLLAGIGVCCNNYLFLAAPIVVLCTVEITDFVFRIAHYTFPEYRAYVRAMINWEFSKKNAPAPEEPVFPLDRLRASAISAMIVSSLALLNVVAFFSDGPFGPEVEAKLAVASFAFLFIHYFTENTVGPLFDGETDEEEAH